MNLLKIQIRENRQSEYEWDLCFNGKTIESFRHLSQVFAYLYENFQILPYGFQVSGTESNPPCLELSYSRKSNN